MKTLLAASLLACLLTATGCSSTSDKGVNVSRPYDIFGAATATPAPATPPAKA